MQNKVASMNRQPLDLCYRHMTGCQPTRHGCLIARDVYHAMAFLKLLLRYDAIDAEWLRRFGVEEWYEIQIDGLVQEYSNFSVLAIEFLH